MPVKFGISFNRPALNQAGALVHVYTDGSVALNHGGTEMGQGLFIKVAQVVAEAFQIDLDHIRVSATTHRQGAEHLADRRLLRLRPQRHGGAECRGADQGPHDRGGGRAFRRARRPRSCSRRTASMPATAAMSFAELAALSWEKRVSLSATGYYRTPKIHWDFATNTGRPFYYFAYGAAAAEVAIDTLTGEIARAARRADAGLRPLAQPGDRPRPDRGRVRAGHGLAHHRGTVVGRRRAACAPTAPRPTRFPAAATCRRSSTRASWPTRPTAKPRSSAPRRSASRR